MGIEKFFSKLQRKSSSKAVNSAGKEGLSGRGSEKAKKKVNKAKANEASADGTVANGSVPGSVPKKASSAKVSATASVSSAAQAKGQAKRQLKRPQDSSRSSSNPTSVMSSTDKRSSTLTSIARSFKESSAEAVCREVACEGLATSAGYCRLHYIKNWKKIKRKEGILKEGKLNQYIEELVAKYPDKYIEAIRQDLANDKDFAKVIYDLDLDESVDEFDVEGGESVDSLIDTIKRDFDDEGETF